MVGNFYFTNSKKTKAIGAIFFNAKSWSLTLHLSHLQLNHSDLIEWRDPLFRYKKPEVVDNVPGNSKTTFTYY